MFYFLAASGTLIVVSSIVLYGAVVYHAKTLEGIALIATMAGLFGVGGVMCVALWMLAWGVP